jgi:DNA-directed RNA polymerase subunit beta
LQTNSYREFLQADASPSKRKNLGLQAVFTEVFPIESYDGKCVLDFHSYEIGEPKLDWLECLREGLTYGAPLYVTFLLKEEKGDQRGKGVHGRTAAHDPAGHVRHQRRRARHRQPVAPLARLAFEATQHPNGKTLHSFRIIPDRGSWYEAQFDTSDLLYVYLDRKKRRRKFLTTTFFRALASWIEGGERARTRIRTAGTDEEILKLFYDIEELSVKEAEKREDLPEQGADRGRRGPGQGPRGGARLRAAVQGGGQADRRTGRHKIKVVDTTWTTGSSSSA